MKLVLALAFISCVQNALVSGAPSPSEYDGQEVLRTFPSTAEQVKQLQDLQESFDFWTRPAINRPTDIRLTQQNRLAMRHFLEAQKIPFEVFIQNLQEAVNKEALSQVRSINAMDWTSYHGVEEIQAWLTDLVRSNNDIAEVIDIGRSTEGRKMLVARIGYPSANGAAKKSYFADGGIHAREWIAPAIITWFVNELLTNRSRYDQLLRDIDFYFLPNANPDGYEFSRISQKNRMWRKTRSNYGKTDKCMGVDPNRNFNVAFGGNGTSSDPCSEIYKGPYAFSEPETKAFSDFINNRNAVWCVYNALHSYAQMILTPWGYTDFPPPDDAALKKLGSEAAAALQAVHGTTYDVGGVTELLSPGAGGSDDWAKGSGNFNYSYTIEVRDTGRYGFLLPANQIIPTAEETWQAVLVQAKFIQNSP